MTGALCSAIQPSHKHDILKTNRWISREFAHAPWRMKTPKPPVGQNVNFHTGSAESNGKITIKLAGHIHAHRATDTHYFNPLRLKPW